MAVREMHEAEYQALRQEILLLYSQRLELLKFAATVATAALAAAIYFDGSGGLFLCIAPLVVLLVCQETIIANRKAVSKVGSYIAVFGPPVFYWEERIRDFPFERHGGPRSFRTTYIWLVGAIGLMLSSAGVFFAIRETISILVPLSATAVWLLYVLFSHRRYHKWDSGADSQQLECWRTLKAKPGHGASGGDTQN